MLGMMRVRKLKRLPKTMLRQLTPLAKRQFESSGDLAWELLDRSETKWAIYNDEGELILIAGLLKQTRLGRPELWMLMCKGFLKNLRQSMRDSRELMSRLLAMEPVVRAKVQCIDKLSCRFAIKLGFRKVEERLFQNGMVNIYEVVQ